MKTINIQVVGKKDFTTKKGDKGVIVFYVCPPFQNGVEGNMAGFFFGDPADSLEVDENYTALLGYDRAGKYGVIDIVERG